MHSFFPRSSIFRAPLSHEGLIQREVDKWNKDELFRVESFELFPWNHSGFQERIFVSFPIHDTVKSTLNRTLFINEVWKKKCNSFNAHCIIKPLLRDNLKKILGITRLTNLINFFNYDITNNYYNFLLILHEREFIIDNL